MDWFEFYGRPWMAAGLAEFAFVLVAIVWDACLMFGCAMAAASFGPLCIPIMMWIGRHYDKRLHGGGSWGKKVERNRRIGLGLCIWIVTWLAAGAAG